MYRFAGRAYFYLFPHADSLSLIRYSEDLLLMSMNFCEHSWHQNYFADIGVMFVFQILFDQAQRSVKQQLHNFVKE